MQLLGRDYLKIYLEDHYAGATAGLELARRTALLLASIVAGGAHVLAVPAPEVKRDATECGQLAPVPPQRRMARIRIVFAERVHGDVLGIEPFEQLVHRLAASRGRHAGDDDCNGELRELASVELRAEQIVP